VVLVQVPLDLDGDPIIVAVDAVAPVALIGDEMTRTKNEVVLGHPDLESRG
jgi:hypothetical protein